MLTLHGAKGSGAAAVEAALRIGGLPTLVLDDGTVMTESAAILIWLGVRHPQTGLLPAEPAQAIRGLVYIAANCYAAIGVIDYPERFCADCDKATGERIRTGTKRDCMRTGTCSPTSSGRT